LRICLVYDHLFPQTIGGAERWLRDLALRLAESGHEVTYLTMRHWRPGAPPSLPGVRILGLTAPGRVYDNDRRTLGPPLRFGAAVARHLFRHGRDYDVVHIGSFPFFPLLAAGAARRRGRYGIFVDWYEVWTLGYWRRYAGPVIGTIGWLVQRACVRVPHRAFCMSRMHAARLLAEGYPGTPTVLPGIYAGAVEPSPGEEVDGTLAVFAGRLVPEKRVGALVRGFAQARERRDDLRLEIYGDGPERAHVEALVRELGLATAVRVLGHRPEEEVAAALGRAACLATASEREGYGLVVVEAAARGTPSVIVAGPENAATELVHEGVNGAVARTSAPDELAGALLRVVEAGPSLRASTSRWFSDNAASLRLEGSLDLVVRSYAKVPSATAPLRVLLVSANFRPSIGGIERFVEVLAHGLAARGHSITVAACRTDGVPLVEQDGAVRIVRIPSTDVLDTRLNVPYPIPNPVASVRVLRRLIADADVVHAHDAIYATTVVSLALAHQQGVPSVLTQHVGFVPQRRRALDVAQHAAIATIGRSSRLATRVVAYNPAIAEWASERWSLPDVGVLPPGVPEAPDVDREHVRRELGLPPERFIALFVGRDVPKKGLDVFLEARDPAYELLAVTDRSPARAPQGTRILPLVEPERFRALLCSVDAFVLPSEGEGFPLALQEALVSGVPCVVTPGPGYDHYLRDGEALFVRREAGEIRAALRRLAADDSARAQLASRARAAGRREFGVERFADAYEELYRQAIAASGQR
jgi:glycosyltransferase involved in cell wall biosynthesis